MAWLDSARVGAARFRARRRAPVDPELGPLGIRISIPGCTLLLISDAVLATTAYIVATYMVMDVDPAVFLRYDGGIWRILVTTASLLVAMYFCDLYRQVRVTSVNMLLQRLSLALGATFIVQGLISYVSRDLRMPIHVMVPGSVFAGIGLVVWRVIFGNFILPWITRTRRNSAEHPGHDPLP